jgi:hypothetical protein
MTYTKNLFAALCSTYPTYTELCTYLTSEAGGALDVVEDEIYAIFHYDKKKSDMTKEHVCWSRSVVWNKVTNRPVAVAPPKAAEMADDFTIGADYQIQEYLEGVTLNVWNSSDGVQVASRTKFGAASGFYSRRSFSELLGEALGDRSLESLVPEGADFASILLQHPEHRVVERIAVPRIVVLHTGTVADDGTVTISEQVVDGPVAVPGPSIVPGTVEEQSVRDWFATEAATRAWEWQGVVIKDGAGNRWRLRSNSYRMVRSLRGQTPRADERFFELRRKGLVKTYLYYYPEDKQRYWRYETWLRDTTAAIYAEYCAVYKEKSKALEAVEKRFQTHVRGLHGRFLAELRAAKKTVTRATAIEYMNSQPTPRLLFLLNIEYRAVKEEVPPPILVQPTIV